ncbi:MAG: hypothetical protein LBK61_05615 [Spirochaetaceae bacterium]|nr:hypothetical protein [Spirochaetaceae bacterium]
MTIMQLKNIVRKDVPIYYKQFYTAVAEIELLGDVVETAIEFSLELKPTGMKEVLVTVQQEIDYPLVPLVTELKNTIIALDRDTKLPA